MTYWDYNEELHNKTIVNETKEADALEMIRNGREDGIPDEKTRSRIKRIGLDDTTIDELFEKIDAESAVPVGSTDN